MTQISKWRKSNILHIDSLKCNKNDTITTWKQLLEINLLLPTDVSFYGQINKTRAAVPNAPHLYLLDLSGIRVHTIGAAITTYA